MLMVQYNCGQGYESIVIALKTALSTRAGIVMVQEPFIGNREISYSGFNFYWPQGERKNIRVITTVKKELVTKIVVNHKMNLVNHPYFILLEIRELDLQSKRLGRKIRVVNVYDNWVRKGCTWNGGIYCIRRALENVNWKPVIQGQVLIARDINAHSPV